MVNKKQKELSDIAEPNTQNIRIGDFVVDSVRIIRNESDSFGMEFRHKRIVEKYGPIFLNPIISVKKDRVILNRVEKEDEDKTVSYNLYERPLDECVILRSDGTYFIGKKSVAKISVKEITRYEVESEK